MSTSSTTGFGFISFDPSNAVVNNRSSIYVSDSSFLGTSVSTTGATGYTTNAEYADTSFGATAASTQYRIVAAGVRIRYIGTELNRGGQVVGLEDPTHSTLNGRVLTSFDLELESARMAVGRDWATVLYHPVVNEEYNFQNTFPPVNMTADLSYYMGLVVAAPTATTPATFEWEAYVVAELQGRNVQSKTMSHVDLTGFSAVHTAQVSSEYLRPSTVPTPVREQGFMVEVRSVVRNGLTWVGQHALGALKTVAVDALRAAPAMLM